MPGPIHLSGRCAVQHRDTGGEVRLELGGVVTHNRVITGDVQSELGGIASTVHPVFAGPVSVLSGRVDVKNGNGIACVGFIIDGGLIADIIALILALLGLTQPSQIPPCVISNSSVRLRGRASSAANVSAHPIQLVSGFLASGCNIGVFDRTLLAGRADAGAQLFADLQFGGVPGEEPHQGGPRFAHDPSYSLGWNDGWQDGLRKMPHVDSAAVSEVNKSRALYDMDPDLYAANLRRRRVR